MLSCLFCALISASAFAAEQVALVKDGKAKAVILVENNNPSTKKAAEELQDMLSRRTGARLQILSGKDTLPAGMLPVYLGLSDRTAKLGARVENIKYDGYFFKATPEYVVIAGRDKPQTSENYYGQHYTICNDKLNFYKFGEKGTVNGVYKILEKYAGNRHYMPGELGDVVPTSPDFTLPVTQYQEAPAFRERIFSAVWLRNASEDFLRWQYRLCSGGENNFINHSYHFMGRYKKTNPEYFALIDGQRDLDKLSTANNHGNLCMTNPEGIKAFADIAIKFFDKNPDYTTFPIVPQDGMYRVCECENCRKLLSPHLGSNGEFSNLVYHHVTEIAKLVAEKHPGKHVGTLAYEKYRMAPEMDLPPNLLVRVCYMRQDLRKPHVRAEIEQVIKSFTAKKVPVCVWTYPLYNHIPPMRGIPVFYPEILQQNIRFNHDNNVIGENSQANYSSGGGDQLIRSRYDNGLPASTHLNDYVRCQLLWDPDLDLKAMLEEYYRLFYGSAAAEMKEFWETSQRLFLKNGEATMYSKEDLDQFTELLDKAEKAAPGNTVHGERVRLLRKELDPFFKTMYLLRDQGKYMGMVLADEEIPMDYSQESIWRFARKYTLIWKDGRTDIPPESVTNVYALANREGMALHIECKEPQMDRILTRCSKRDDAKAWLDDCLEIFLSTRDREENLQYIITAGGCIMDSSRGADINVAADLAWNGNIQLKQTRAKDGYASTVFIPWSDLGCNGNNLPEMIFQIYRRQTHGNDQFGDYFVMFPSAAFHNYSPEYFGRIRFFSAQNRIANGNFEKIGANGKVEDWEGKDFLCSDRPSEGKYCAKLVRDPKLNFHSINSKSFAVTEGCDYVLSLKQRGDSGYAYVQFFDAAGKAVAEPGVPFYWMGNTNEWKSYTFCGRVPAKAVRCYVILRNFSAGEYSGVCFDQVEFVAGWEK